MNYNNKKHELEMDDLNIKAHLNTSLDLSGISVSEDLINRTLAAIKASEQEKAPEEVVSEKESTIGKRVIPFGRYIRGIAGVAAAVFIVIVGYGVLKTVNFKADNNTKSAAPEMTYDMAADTAAQDGSTISMAESTGAALAEEEMAALESENKVASDDSVGIAATEPKEKEILYSITAQTDSGNANYGSASGKGEDGSSANDTSTEYDNLKVGASLTAKADEDMSMKSAGIIELSFRDIFLPDASKAEYITIKNETDGTNITLTEQTPIEEFYDMMDINQFIHVSDANTELSYSVEARGYESGALYTMVVGNYIEITYSEGEMGSYSIYQAVDHALLKQNLDEFYKKHINK